MFPAILGRKVGMTQVFAASGERTPVTLVEAGPCIVLQVKRTDSQDRYKPLKKEEAAELRAELLKAIALMPHFGPARHLLGFLEMAQGEDLAKAEQQLRLAVQLEPENTSYLLSLAQVQIRERDSAGARRTLEPLLLPNADPKLRHAAEDIIREDKEARR